jgi:hypothetical protein
VLRKARRALRALGAAPPGLQLMGGLLALIALWLAANWVVQVARKPTELFFPASGVLHKSPAETWRQYAPMFREHATAVITPDFLAALAQAESAGNPVARTYWRWRLTEDPFDVYRPASSAVGMFQITDGTFREARRYCIHDHVAVEDGPWHDPKSCWFNSLYLRVVPSHAAEMISAFLDRHVARTLDRQRVGAATLEQKRDLAAVIHLCGVRAGEAFAARGFRLTANQRCGDQDVRGYLVRINQIRQVFGPLMNVAPQ